MSSENKRLTGVCVPAVIDPFEYEPRSESIGLPVSLQLIATSCLREIANIEI
jgi:hypothetical protein